jgi:hypothetical protein
MLQQGNIQLHHVRQEISRQVAFPEELSLSFNETAARALLDEILTCNAREDLLKLTFGLSRRRLNDLFGAVLIVSAAQGEEPINRVLDIFRKRASVSLAQMAWAFYQRHYPNDRLARVLSTLVRSLAGKEEQQAFLLELQQTTIDHLLPKRLADSLIKNPDNLAQAKIDQAKPSEEKTSLKDKFPLLAEYTSLTSLLQEEETAACLSSGLCGYMVRLAILPDTAFAAAFLTAYFQEAADAEILANTDLFLQSLHLNRQPAQLLLMRRYLREHRMARSWDTLNSALLELFGSPPLRSAVKTERAQTPARNPSDKSTAGDPFAPKAPVDPFASRGGDLADWPQRTSPIADPAQSQPAAGRSKPNQGTEAGSGGILGWLRGRKKTPAAPPKTPPQPAVKTEQHDYNDPDLVFAAPIVTKWPPDPADVAVEPVKQPVSIQPETKSGSVIQTDALSELQQALLSGIPYAQAEQSGPADLDIPIWLRLEPEMVNRFRQWDFMHQLSQHNQGFGGRKMLFFQRYAMTIQSISRWDEQTLVVDFGAYVIADHCDEEDRLWYYDHTTYQMLAERRHGRPALHRPEQPFINSRDAMLQETRHNIVCLKLDDVNMLYAHDFVRRIQDPIASAG